MLLTVVRRGVFSASAAGYCKGLTLLLLAPKNEEKSMRVTPWSEYQLVDQGTDPLLQLASRKNRLVRGCAIFACFGCSAAGPESPPPLEVVPTQNQEIYQEPLDSDERKDQVLSADHDDGYDDTTRTIVSLKSSLKKSVNLAGNTDNNAALREKDNGFTCQTERRKVQWTDTIGGELFEIREFEMSEDESDDEFDNGIGKTCSCTIM